MMSEDEPIWRDLPGQEIVDQGLEDLAQGRLDTPEVMLLSMARSKLVYLGLPLSLERLAQIEEPELTLYQLMRERYPGNPFGQYKALRRRLAKLEHALTARKYRLLRALREAGEAGDV